MVDQSTLDLQIGSDEIRIELAPEALADLKADLRIRRGQAHGLLLGSRNKISASFQSIDNCFALGGPGGAEEEPDVAASLEDMREIVLTWREMQDMPAPVGVYMGSFNGDAESLCRGVLPKLQMFFAGPRYLFLCAHLGENPAPVEAIMLAEDTALCGRGRLLLEIPDLEPPPAASPRVPLVRVAEEESVFPSFPVADSFSPAAAAPLETAEGAIANREPPPPAARQEQPARSESRKRRFGFWAGVGVAVALSGIAAGAAWWTLFRPPADTKAKAAVVTPQPALDLQATRRGTDLELTWNRSSSLIQSAQRGFLYIDDGGRRTQLFLEDSHLRTGRVVYSPISQDINVRLEVVSPDDRIIRESLRLVRAGVAEGVVETAAVQLSPDSRIRVGDGTAIPASGVPGTTVPNPNPAGSAERRAFVPPASTAGRSSLAPGVARLELSPPDVSVPHQELAQAGSRVPGDSTEPIGVAPPPVDSGPKPAIQTPAAAQAPAPKPAASVPAFRSTDRLTPVPIQQVPVSFPLNLRPLLTREVVINVDLSIDAAGKVVTAHAARPTTALEYQLTRIALEGAKEWRFDPATRAGVPIAGRYTVVYRFRRQ